MHSVPIPCPESPGIKPGKGISIKHLLEILHLDSISTFLTKGRLDGQVMLPACPGIGHQVNCSHHGAALCNHRVHHK
eukprot:10635251-Ditylum_brightwellii.AAC.1